MDVNELLTQLQVKQHKGYFTCRCPKCGQKSGYFYRDNLESIQNKESRKLIIHCNRLNKCGRNSVIDVDTTDKFEIPKLNDDALEISPKGKEILNWMAFIKGSDGNTWPGFDFDYRGISNQLLKEAHIIYLREGLLEFMKAKKSMFSRRFFETGYAYQERDLLIPIFDEEGKQVDRLLLRDRHRRCQPKELQLRLNTDGNEIWNLHDLMKGKKYYFVTEGVWDGLSILQADPTVGVLSLPGVKKCRKLIEYLRKHTDLWDELNFIVCFDLDKAGEKYSEKFLRYLKIFGIPSASLNLRGNKDVNEMLETDPKTLKKEIRNAKDRINKKIEARKEQMKKDGYTDLAKEKIKEFEQKMVELYKDPTDFQAWLKTALKFRQYSYSNQMLIHAANPNATYLATSHRWKQLGVNVLDFHPINIVRPNYTKYILVDGKRILWKDMTKQQKQDVEDKKIKLYTYMSSMGCCPLFDITQTDATEEMLMKLVIEKKKDHDLEKVYEKLCTEYEIEPEEKKVPILQRLYDFFGLQFNSFELTEDFSCEEKAVAKECYIYAALDTLGIASEICDFNILNDLDEQTSIDRLKTLSKQIESLIKTQIAELSQWIM